MKNETKKWVVKKNRIKKIYCVYTLRQKEKKKKFNRDNSQEISQKIE